MLCRLRGIAKKAGSCYNPAMIKDPTQIEGLVVWIETDESGEIIDRIKESGLNNGSSVYCWVDPNNPGIGCELVFSRQLTEAENAQIQEWLVGRFNPPMNDLPRS